MLPDAELVVFGGVPSWKVKENAPTPIASLGISNSGFRRCQSYPPVVENGPTSHEVVLPDEHLT